MSLIKKIENFLMRKYHHYSEFKYRNVLFFYALLFLSIIFLGFLFYHLFLIWGMNIIPLNILYVLLFIIIIIIILYLGYKETAGNLYLGILALLIWANLIIIDSKTPIARIDNLFYIFVPIVVAPILTRLISVIIHYAINAALLVIYLYHLHSISYLDSFSFSDYARDAGITVLFIMIFSAMTFTANRRNSERMKKDNKKLQSMNLELAATMEELEATNEELTSTMDTLEITMTELEESNQKNQDQAAHLKKILDSMPLPLTAVFEDGRVSMINQPFINLFGLPGNNDLFVDDILQYLIRDDITRQNINEAFKNSKIKPGEPEPFNIDAINIKSINKGMRIVNINGTRAGELIILLFSDTTELTRSREIMIQTEKMMTVGGLSAGMAHEINNPLGIITQAATMLRRRFDWENNKIRKDAEEYSLNIEALKKYFDDKKIAKYLSAVFDATDRASKIIRNMLDFSRKSESPPELIDIHAYLDKSLQLVSHDYTIKKHYLPDQVNFIRDYAQKDLMIKAHAVELEQVFINLFKNSIQAMSKKNGDTYSPKITISTVTLENDAVIKIRDNGPGIDTKIMSTIFEPFITTKGKESGTGLGLSVSRYIIEELHSGSITVDSSRDNWTEFTITLPVS